MKFVRLHFLKHYGFDLSQNLSALNICRLNLVLPRWFSSCADDPCLIIHVFLTVSRYSFYFISHLFMHLFFIINTSISLFMSAGIFIGSPPCLAIIFFSFGWIFSYFIADFSPQKLAYLVNCYFLIFIFSSYCMDVFLHVCQFMMCIQCRQKPEECHGSLRLQF